MWERLRYAMAQGISAYRMGPTPQEIDWLQARYSQRWALYDGTLFEAMGRTELARTDPAIYRNTRLLWKHAESVVDFYAGVVYQGALSDQPEQGAIPIKLLVDGDWETAEGLPADTPAGRLWAAILELQAAWSWQKQMTRRPMYTSAQGDSLCELVDNLDRRFVYPKLVWPGYVKTIELDDVDNVQAYALEYHVDERDENGKQIETYTYRKMVDKETIRTYKNDGPFGYDGKPAAFPNPYGFVPAIWDRHRDGEQDMVRGRSVLDGTRQAMMQLNSIFSHAFDYQQKPMFQPIIVSTRGGGTANINLSAPNGTGQELAESQAYVTVPEGANLLQAKADLGDVRGLMEDIREGILAENPEAQFFSRIREMQTVTAPGVAAAQGDVVNRVNLCRGGYDENTVKLFQMAIAMCGHRANGPEWQRDRNGRSIPLDRRRQAFLRFDLQSFDRGELDHTILSRPLVAPTEEERLAIILQKESIQSTWGMKEAGLSDDDVTAIMAERAATETLAAF